MDLSLLVLSASRKKIFSAQRLGYLILETAVAGKLSQAPEVASA
jgi:hypothetical protein